MDIILSNASGKPIYEQITDQVKEQIMAGTLSAGDALPSMRLLAKELRISVITTKRAYEELERDGFLENVPGKGCFVAPQNRELLREAQLRKVEEKLSQAVDEARKGAFPLEEREVLALMESVKAAVPALIERLKDTRPPAVINRELLEQLGLAPPERGEDWTLTDGQWDRLRDLFPPEKGGRGRALKSNRLMLEGILYRMRTGAAWKDLPARYGRYKCVSDRLSLWTRTGVWDRALPRLRELGLLDGPEDV